MGRRIVCQKKARDTPLAKILIEESLESFGMDFKSSQKKGYVFSFAKNKTKQNKSNQIKMIEKSIIL